MSRPSRDHEELLSALDKTFSKYFEERDDPTKGKSPENKFWGTYMRAMQDEDEQRPRDWDGNTGSILTFSGLFAATVAAFVIESYHSLSPDSGDQTVLLLAHLLNATTNSTSDAVVNVVSAEPFQLSASAVLVNILWFCSLLIVLACALLATLVQQWSRDYTRDIKRRDVLDESLVSRAYNHVYIRMGVDRYGMDEVVNLLVSLVHLSVILFAIGLMLFLFPINSAVAWCSLFVLAVFGIAYCSASLLSIFDTSCPYRTPLTLPLSFGHWLLGRLSHSVRVMLRQGDFSPLTEAVLDWCYGVLPPASTQLIPKRRAVYPHTEDDAFLSVVRFRFAWLHTSRQMLDSDLKILLQFVMAKLASMPEMPREECIRHLERDEQLKSRFQPIGSCWPGTVDYEADVVGYQMCCILFQRFYDGYLDASLYERDNDALMGYLRGVMSGSTTSSITMHSAMYALLTRMCLFYMRWYLLLVLSDADEEESIAGQDVIRMMSYIYPDHERTEVHEIDGFGLRSYPESIGQPYTLLHILNSWTVNSMDSAGHRDYGETEENARSCLIPLHDDACCRRSDAMRHAAACNVLTMIAHLIHAPEHERMQFLRQRKEYDNLLNHGASPFVEWINEVEVRDDERQQAPSTEFLVVLRNARLEPWLNPGNDFSYVPPYSQSVGRLMRSKISNRDVRDSISFPPTSTTITTIADVLRALARRVNFKILPLQSEHREPPADPDPEVGADLDSDFDSQGGSASGSSSDPVLGSFAEYPAIHLSAGSQTTSRSDGAAAMITSSVQSSSHSRSQSVMSQSHPLAIASLEGPTVATADARARESPTSLAHVSVSSNAVPSIEPSLTHEEKAPASTPTVAHVMLTPEPPRLTGSGVHEAESEQLTGTMSYAAEMQRELAPTQTDTEKQFTAASKTLHENSSEGPVSSSIPQSDTALSVVEARAGTPIDSDLEQTTGNSVFGGSCLTIAQKTAQD
ncbi:unnamed protein product [Peniophora sp. CBMAI 1063]|nr:unnamed protein product [Peniophora sp. CBMAI 1063]